MLLRPYAYDKLVCTCLRDDIGQEFLWSVHVDAYYMTFFWKFQLYCFHKLSRMDTSTALCAMPRDQLHDLMFLERFSLFRSISRISRRSCWKVLPFDESLKLNCSSTYNSESIGTVWLRLSSYRCCGLLPFVLDPGKRRCYPSIVRTNWPLWSKRSAICRQW